MFPKQFHSWVYFTALALVGVSLPFSVFVISVATITLMVNWLLEGGFQQKWDTISNKRSLWVLLAFYALHLLSLLAATVICSYYIFKLHINPANEENDYFPFVSHIRLSLMMVMGIFTIP